MKRIIVFLILIMIVLSNGMATAGFFTPLNSKEIEKIMNRPGNVCPTCREGRQVLDRIPFYEPHNNINIKDSLDALKNVFISSNYSSYPCCKVTAKLSIQKATEVINLINGWKVKGENFLLFMKKELKEQS